MSLAKQLVIALVALAFTACLAPQNVTMVGVDVRSWSEGATLTVENNDTLSLRNLNIAVRYNNNFKATELPLKIAILAPDSSRYEEIISLPLRRPTTALAVATTESLPYRSKVQLSQRGSYHISFEPLSKICGVEAIGVEFREIE